MKSLVDAGQDLGVTLQKVVLSHPEPDRLRRMLEQLQVGHLAEIEQGVPGLSFVLHGPKGTAKLD